jgi:HEAT repeat protein
MLYSQESEELKKSSWPKCDVLAEALAARGPSAVEALIAASTSRTHHVRSAVLRGLSKVAPERARPLAEKLLEDRAYEVRETAAKILDLPKPS